MDGKLRHMTSIYLYDDEKMLMLYRIGSRVVNNSYIGTAGGHFENNELNDAKKCILRELDWFKYNEIHELNMPHTAKYVVEHFIKEGKNNNKLYGGIAIPNGVSFTELKEFLD